MQRKWRRDWERSRNQKNDGAAGRRNPFAALAKSILPPVAAAGLLLNSFGVAYALPTGVVVTNGTATVTQTGDTMNVNQTSGRLIVNSTTFNIAANETVNLYQPSTSSSALWRVVGPDPSSIYGHLNATGHLYLINANGILFAPGAQVNVGGIVASTLNISDSDYLAGNNKFTNDGKAGSVVNQGTITAENYAVLLGPQVKNEGVIAAKVTALASGNAVSLDFTGDNLLNVTVDTAAAGGNVANSGQILADGGLVIMSTGTKDDLLATVVNNSGVIEAQSAGSVNGVILLTGDTVVNSGTLDASGKNTGETGGTVKVLGNTVTLADGAKVDVSGDAGGGTALIGGNYQGKGTERNATTTNVAATAIINADAITDGDGGKVVVWSDDTTTFNGSISAKGGAAGGNGGQVETSGHKKLTVGDTARVTTAAAHGIAGNWLLDPNDFTIGAGGDMSAATLAANLAGGNITILSGDGATAGSGDINVNGAITWSSGNTLTLSAYRDVNVNSAITGTGSLVLRADNTSKGTAVLGANHGTVNINANIGLSGNGTGLALTTATGGYNLGSGARITLSGSGATFSLNGTAYTVINDYSTGGALQALQNINSSSTTLARKYFLGVDVDASATSGWNGGAGWTPIGNSSTNFKGIFDGGGHVISGLTINDSSATFNNNLGLFGFTLSSTIRNVGLEDVNITYAGYNARVGALVGADNRGTITNCYSTGTLNFQSYSTTPSLVGGLVGYAYRDTVTNSYSAVNIHATGVNAGSSFGGFVGNGGGLGGKIINCYSTGAVDVTADVGYTGYMYVGGLAGGFFGNAASLLQNSYSSGSVTLTYTAAPTGTSVAFLPAVGGLVGYNYSTGAIQNCYSTSEVTANVGNAYVGGLAGVGNYISNSYSTGKINNNGSGNSVGGVAGYGEAGRITASYWDTQTTGVSEGVGNISGYSGVTGLTTAQMMSRTYLRDTLGWDFTNTWYMIDGYTRPFLQMEYSTNITNAHQLQLMVMQPDAAYTLGRSFDAGGAFAADAGMWLTQNTASLAGKTSYGFVPVGDSADPFTGTFAGNGNIISGLSISNSGAYAGLFGHVKDAVISNLGLDAATVSGGTGTAVGALAGWNEGGTISGVYSSGTVSGGAHTGGLVGYNTGTIADSYSISTVSGTGHVGGLVGTNAAGGQISNSYSAGAVSGGTAGGLVGKNDGTVSGSVWKKTDPGQNGVGGGSGTADVTGMSTDGSYPAAWSAATWQAGFTRPILRWQLTNGYITAVDQLLLISLNPGGKYKLGNNLDLTSYLTDHPWTPIGADAAHAFTGTLLGNGHTISGLTISSSDTISSATYLGLFGYTQGATISGVNLTGVSITGTGTSQYIGSLAGYSGAGTTITGCSSAGTVTANGATSYVGGLVGENTGSIQNSVNAATVTGNGDGSYIGGVTGRNATGGSISGSSNTGAVIAAGTGSYAGGLAGVNDGGITGASYNAATVTARGAHNWAGGLVGLNNSSLTSLYNTGTVASEAGGNVIGGLVGENNGAITNCYSDAMVETTGSAANNIVGGLVGTNDITREITGSYVTGLVSAQGDGSTVGGLAGKNDGKVEHSYSMVVTRSTGAGGNVGGLVGENTGTGTIRNAFSVGAVTGSGGNVGGLVGSNGGTITNALWATDTSGQANGVCSGPDTGVRGLTFADMRRSANYDGTWDAGKWGITDSFLPYLKWQYSTTPTLAFTGTVEGGAGQRVNLVYNDYVNGARQIGQAHVFGADGFYYGVGTGTVQGNIQMLLYVAGDPNYKATSVLLAGTGLTNGYLKKDTLYVDLTGASQPNIEVLRNAKGNLATDDIIYDYDPFTGITVYGDLEAKNFQLEQGGTIYSGSNRGIRAVATGSAAGSITINNDGDFIVNDGFSADHQGVYPPGDQQIRADGDINITTGGYLVLRHGATTYTQLIAGGNITLTAKGGFANYSGANALSAGGRWLVYAPAQMIYPTDRALFFDYSLYPDVINGTNTYMMPDGTRRNIRELTMDTANGEIGYDVRGGLSGDFVLWGRNYGDAIPAAGSGFIFAESSPLTRPLTPAQIQRREAVNAAQSDHNQTGAGPTGPDRRLDTAAPPLAKVPGESKETLPFLTVTDGGIKRESENEE